MVCSDNVIRVLKADHFAITIKENNDQKWTVFPVTYRKYTDSL